ncbi:Transcription termination factor 2 [Sergentomyia squamirostris]
MSDPEENNHVQSSRNDKNKTSTMDKEKPADNDKVLKRKITRRSLNILSDSDESDDADLDVFTPKMSKYSEASRFRNDSQDELSESSFSSNIRTKRSSTPVAGPSWRVDCEPTMREIIDLQDVERSEKKTSVVPAKTGVNFAERSRQENNENCPPNLGSRHFQQTRLYSSDTTDSVDLNYIRGIFSLDQPTHSESIPVHHSNYESSGLEVFYDGDIPDDYIELDTIDIKREVTSSGLFSNVNDRILSHREQNQFEGRKLITNETLENIKKNLDSCPSEDTLMDQPDGLRVPLMDHQKYALSFMSWRERSNPKGGILADDMGTGKTLTILSLILLDQQCPDESSEQGHSRTWLSTAQKRLTKGGTLVVCPATLMQQWCNEVDTKCRPAMIETYKYHGPGRVTNAHELGKFDLVVTTYSTLNHELAKCGPLFRVNWHRVVLDEGHVIRNHNTANALACFELTSTRRWILTGTPLHNYIKDLFSVMKFIRCSPFSDHDYWKVFIGDRDPKLNGVARLHAILKTVMLRRTKAELEEKGILQKLPDKNIKIISVELSKDEKMLYQKFLLCSQTLFVEYLHQQEKSTRKDENFRAKTRGIYEQIAAAYMSGEIPVTFIFVLILRLRQICCHPNLLKMANPENDNEAGASTTAGPSNSSDQMSLVDFVDKLDMTKENIALTNLPSLKYNKEILLANKPSTKLSHILSEMEIIMARGEKMVVISQWVQFLDILERHLLKKGWYYLMLTGRTKITERGNMLAEFNDPNNRSKILLLSLGTGGVGLNLVGANNIFLMDSHWNPQWELQAEDRVYRIGQTKPVTVYKYVTVNSIEERIVELQKKKLEMARNVLTGAKRTSGGGLTIADLRVLFSM